MTGTPLLDRIEARRKLGVVGPNCPVPITKHVSEFTRRLIEKRLTPKILSNGAWTPAGSDGAA